MRLYFTHIPPGGMLNQVVHPFHYAALSARQLCILLVQACLCFLVRVFHSHYLYECAHAVLYSCEDCVCSCDAIVCCVHVRSPVCVALCVYACRAYMLVCITCCMCVMRCVACCCPHPRQRHPGEELEPFVRRSSEAAAGGARGCRGLLLQLQYTKKFSHKNY